MLQRIKIQAQFQILSLGHQMAETLSLLIVLSDYKNIVYVYRVMMPSTKQARTYQCDTVSSQKVSTRLLHLSLGLEFKKCESTDLLQPAHLNLSSSMLLTIQSLCSTNSIFLCIRYSSSCFSSGDLATSVIHLTKIERRSMQENYRDAIQIIHSLITVDLPFFRGHHIFVVFAVGIQFVKIS